MTGSGGDTPSRSLALVFLAAPILARRRDMLFPLLFHAGGPHEGGPTYLVQLSTDDGQTWSTIGMGLRQPQVTIDRNLLQGAKQVKIQVSSTNGFHTESTTKTLSVDDL